MSSQQSPGPVTQLLARVSDGDPSATEALFPLVYEELRRLARSRMARERPGQTLTPTALVHETYLRLVGEDELPWQNRRHFFGAAGEAMRRILVERARAKGREKRGGAWRRTTLDHEVARAGAADEPRTPDILALDEALRRLEEIDAEMSTVVKLRYFAGLTIAETAKALETSVATVNRQWAAAKAWLFDAMTREPE